MKRTLMIALPLAVIAASAAIAVAMYLNRPAPEVRPTARVVPLIRTGTVRLEDLQLKVRSQGTVSPRTETVLVPEVAGRILETASSFETGGFFAAGEMLVRIDPFDYRQAVVQARSRVAQAELRLAQEQAEAEVAAREWRDLGEGDPDPLTLRLPQLADAAAAVEAARAELERADRNLLRTEVQAPYAGRVRDKQVDVGQYVSPGTPLATLYAVDFAEVRLPLPDAELAYLDLPLQRRGDEPLGPGPRVILRAEFAGRLHRWEGRIVRTEGEIDPRTRMVTLVAQVKDPYGAGAEPGRPPLAAGLFVEAEILGEQVQGVAALPREALRSDGRVLVVDGDDRLHFREVEVLRRTEERVFIRAGLQEGERVCLSPLAVVVDGMTVRTGEAG